MSDSSSEPQPPTPPHLHLHVGSTTSAAAAATKLSGAAAPACAACKYQRRKCAPECPLAPYFPADEPRRFVNAHRLFGVSNIQKALRRIEPKYAPDAMRSIIYEADARAADPVAGCVGIIEELQRQIHDAETELQVVRQQIEICRQASSFSDPAAAAAMIVPPAAVAPGQQADGGMVPLDAIYAAGQHPSIPFGAGVGSGPQQDYHVFNNDPSSSQEQRRLYDYFCYNNGAAVGDVATSDPGMQQYVKPEVLPATAIQHHGGPAVAAAGDVLHHPEQKKLGRPPVLMKHEHEDEDEDMEEQQAATAAGAPCHLELGFSSFLSDDA